MCEMVQSANGIRLYLQRTCPVGGAKIHRINNLCSALVCSAELGDTEGYTEALAQLVAIVGPELLHAPRLV